MDFANLSQVRISQISTLWSELVKAHQGPSEEVGAAQQQLIERYSPAVFQYLLGAVRDAEAADELFQEFALRFLRGDFKRVNPERGRFRDYLKTTLQRLVIDYFRRKGKGARPLETEPEAGAAPVADPDLDFHALWRGVLLARAWEALERIEKDTGQPHFTVLRLRANHPELKAPQLAEKLSSLLGKEVTGHWVRNRLYAAREKFTDLILHEVRQGLEDPTPAALEQEVIALGLLDYCRDALERR